MSGSRFGDGACLGQGEGFEPAGESEDLPGQGGRLEPCVVGVHADDGHFPHPGPDGGSLVRGRGDVVSLDHFRARTLREHEFLLWQQVFVNVRSSSQIAFSKSGSGQVRVGICDFSKVPGLVGDRPRDGSLPRSGAGGRAIVAALMSTMRIGLGSDAASRVTGRSGLACLLGRQTRRRVRRMTSPHTER